MTLLSTTTMTYEFGKNKNNANEVAKTRTMQMRLLSKRMMTNEVAKHIHNGK